MAPLGGFAAFDGLVARDIIEVATDPAALDSGGWWVVVAPFEGGLRAYRFAEVVPEVLADRDCPDVPLHAWRSSMSRDQYLDAVDEIRAEIARGWVYQVNLCRVLSAALPAPVDPIALYQRLSRGNPAPYAGLLSVPGELDVVCASPELMLRRDADQVVSSPIKGTAATADTMLDKDTAENIMIVDLVRNDLARVAVPGGVSVPQLLRVEPHPGLVHLVSDVAVRLRPDAGWSDILAAVLPAGSVSGAPKSSALEVIGRLERAARDVYCGAFGWIDANKREAQLAVAIRTFWQVPDGDGALLRFGTGAGITWGSDPSGEWDETELKAHRLLRVLSGEVGRDALLV